MKNLCAAAIPGSGLVKWGHDSSWQHTHHNPLFWSSGQHRNTLGPVAEAERPHSGGEQTLGGVDFFCFVFFFRSGNDLWNAHLELYLKQFFASQARVCRERWIGNILSPASIKRGNIYIGEGGDITWHPFAPQRAKQTAMCEEGRHMNDLEIWACFRQSQTNLSQSVFLYYAIWTLWVLAGRPTG